MTITEDAIKQACIQFDGTCPWAEHNTECLIMSVTNCNRCKITTGEGGIGSTGKVWEPTGEE